MLSTLLAFSKFDGEAAPDTFLSDFITEAGLCGIIDHARVSHIFPSMMTRSETAM